LYSVDFSQQFSPQLQAFLIICCLVWLVLQRHRYLTAGDCRTIEQCKAQC